jgi:hypothetical protein
MADDAAFTVGSTSITPVGGTYKSVRDLVDDNDAGAFAMTEYTEDAIATANPAGGAQILVANATPASEVADGDYVARRGTQYGAAYSQIVDSTGNFIDSFGGGVQYTEGAIDASITGTAILWEDAADTLATVSAANPLPVVANAGTGPVAGSGWFVRITDGVETAAVDTNLRLTVYDNHMPVDAIGTSFPASVMVVGGRDNGTGFTEPFITDPTEGLLVDLGANNDVDVTTWGTTTVSIATTGADGMANSINPRVHAHTMAFNGTTWDRVRGDVANGMDVDVTRSALPTGAATSAAQLPDGHNVTVDNASGGSAVNIQDGGNSITVDGAAADDVAISGSPVPIALAARTTDRTAVGAGDAVYPTADTLGKAVVLPYATSSEMTNGALTKSSTGAADLIAAPGAGTRLYITSISASNTNATTAVRVDFLDGATTIASFQLAKAGGGVAYTLPTPVRLSDNTALRVDLSAAVTDVRFSAQGYTADN